MFDSHGRMWEELPLASESKPLRSDRLPKQKSYTKDRDEVDVLSTGFTAREIGPQAIRLWLALQAVGLFFEFNLWREVSAHLADFEDVVARECAPTHQVHGVCAGPSWNSTAYQDFILSGHQQHIFQFATASQPPTFLLVMDPVTRAKGMEVPPAAAEAWQDEQLLDIRWTVEVRRLRPVQSVSAFKAYRSGQQVLTAQDMSDEATAAVQRGEPVRWEAKVQLSSSHRYNVRFVALVEDAVSTQLLAVHQHPQCSFGTSWKAFNRQHQGRSHRALSWCRFLLGMFLLVGAAAVYAVRQSLETRSVNIRRFHMVVLLKFFLQDAPQQTCFVLYLFGWYEASGLRCQLCLFDAAHCGDEDAFHFANVVSIGCILLSSLANQLLIRPVKKRKYTEDDICMQLWIRIGGTCVAALPFTTGLCLASRSLLSSPTFVHLLFAVPCVVGWMSISGFLCLGILILCDEDD